MGPCLTKPRAEEPTGESPLGDVDTSERPENGGQSGDDPDDPWTRIPTCFRGQPRPLCYEENPTEGAARSLMFYKGPLHLSSWQHRHMAEANPDVAGETREEFEDPSEDSKPHLCTACRALTAANMDFLLLPGVPGEMCVFKSEGNDDFENLPGYEYPYTLEQLEGRRESCPLCRLIHTAIYRGGDLTTLLSRDPKSRFRLAWCQLPLSSSRSKNYEMKACLRVHLSKPANARCKGNYAPILLRAYTPPNEEVDLSWLGFGRKILPPECDQSFERLKWHLRECLKDHPACARSIDGSICDEEALPTRVIDLGEDALSNPVLIETTGLRGKYCALSYCWGKPSASSPAQTTKSNLESLKRELPVQDMPRTIQDALEVTKRLGFRYIWIDRLCIIQDDTADWEGEARQMARIYENAVLTLAAMGAKDSSEGLFLPRQDEDSVYLPLKGLQLHISLPPVPVDQQTHELKQSALEMKSSVWGTRAWVFQERLFSRRMVLYGNQQILWHCRVHLKTECEFGYDPGYSMRSSKFLYAEDFKNRVAERIVKLVSGSTQDGTGSSSAPGSADGVWEEPWAWAEIIAQYSALDLTFEKDRLPAINSLSQVVQTMTGQDVCAGMWLGSLPGILFWWPYWWDEMEIEQNGWRYPPVAGATTPRPTRSSMVGAPSWSWLAAGTPVSFYPFFRDTSLSIDSPKFIHGGTAPPKLELGAHVVAASRGQKTTPQILKTKYEKFHRFPSTNFNGIWDRWEADGIYGLVMVQGRTSFDGLVLFDNPAVAPEDLECLVIGAGPGVGDDNDRDTVYLVILEAVEGGNEFKRIGIGFILLEPGSDYLRGLELKRRITLV